MIEYKDPNRGSESQTERTLSPRVRQDQSVEARLLILAAQREGNRLLMQALKPLGLTAQAEVISVLAEREPLTVAELGHYIVCETGSPSRLVDNCVKNNLVKREEGQSDRRTVQLWLAPAGQALLPLIQEIDDGIGSIIAVQIDERTLSVLTDSLYQMLKGTTGGAKVSRRFRERMTPTTA
jgi:DNA-binding MarR family transcriptional regulator